MHADTTRRQFIKTSTVAAAALAASPLAAGPRAAAAEIDTMDVGKHIYKSLKWGMIREKLSVMDKFKLLKDLGYDGVEIDSPGGANKKEVRAAVEATGLPVDGIVDSTHWQVRLSSPDAATREKGLRDLLTAITDTHYVGGYSVLVVPGHGKDGSQEQVAARSREQIKKALPLAAKLGVFILIENVWNQFLYDHDGPGNQSAQRLADYIDSFDSPWLGVHFDIGNHIKYGPPHEWIRTLGRRIVKLDAKDFKIGAGGGFCKIGEGSADWPEIRKALASIGYTGWAAAEVGGGDRTRLKEVLGNMNKTLGATDKAV